MIVFSLQDTEAIDASALQLITEVVEAYAARSVLVRRRPLATSGSSLTFTSPTRYIGPTSSQLSWLAWKKAVSSRCLVMASPTLAVSLVLRSL